MSGEHIVGVILFIVVIVGAPVGGLLLWHFFPDAFKQYASKEKTHSDYVRTP